MNLSNKFYPIAFRPQTALLIYVCLLLGGPWAFAQSEFSIDQTDSSDAKPAAPSQNPQSGKITRTDDGSLGLPVFFAIGIAINAVLMLSFAVWFISEWKKKNKEKDGGKR